MSSGEYYDKEFKSRDKPVSVYFSYLVDELAEIEERLSQDDLAPHTTALRRAISRAYVQALLAARSAEAEVARIKLAEQAQRAA